MDNQFAYRQNSSTTCLLIAMHIHIVDLLKVNSHVFLISFDYSKAFDTLAHGPLVDKLSDLPDLPESSLNRIIDYLSNRKHIIHFQNEDSTPREINASIVQGSVLGPTLFNVNSCNLQPLSDLNAYFKYADDGYLVIPGGNFASIPLEIEHHSKWADNFNLKLNVSKTNEIVFTNRNCPPVAPTPGVQRVETMKALGVIIDNKLKFQDHINYVTANCSQTFFALRTLKHHGLSPDILRSIFKSTIIPKLLYAAPSFWGFLTASATNQLQSVLNRAAKFNYYNKSDPDITHLVLRMEMDLFHKIQINSDHILYYLLPEKKNNKYNLRNFMQFKLPCKDDRKFINRMLFRSVRSQ